MRLKLTLEAINTQTLPANYQYYFSAALYKLLRFGSKEFSEFLHNTGFKVKSKSFKLFCFSIKFDNKPWFKNNILLLPTKNLYLYITSPLNEDFVKNILIGSFTENLVEISDGKTFSKFTIRNIESLTEFQISNEMNFTLYSPLVLSIKINDYKSQYYLRYNDDIDKINEILNNNLRKKYFLINNNDLTDDYVTLEWDKEYIIKNEAKKKKLTRAQSVNKDDENIMVIGNMVPFKLTGSEKLIKTGIDCGFGEKNSLGFGYAVTA